MRENRAATARGRGAPPGGLAAHSTPAGNTGPLPALRGGVRRLLEINVNPLIFWLGVAAVVALRLAIAASQRVFLTPEGASLDDMLMVRAGMSVAGGDWLGPYSDLAIAKHMGFALWLALVHASGLPLLVAGAGLWLLCSGFAVWALRPLLGGRLVRLLLFAFLALQPFTYSQYTMRAYRDAIFPAFCLLVFAGAFGLCARMWRRAMPRGAAGAVGGLAGTLCCALGCGAGLAGVVLLREDGAVVVAYAVAAIGLAAAYVLLKKGYARRAASLLCLAAPFGVLAAAVLAFCAANYANYGVFLLSDLSGGSFPRAYGAVTAVSRAESGHTPGVPVTRAALDKLFAAVPALADLAPLMEEDAYAFVAYNNGEGEFGGSFYYALRSAANGAGKTPTAPAAQAYWRQVAEETEDAVAAGALQSGRPGRSLVPAWGAALLGPTLAETGRGFMAVMTFAECTPQPGESLGDAEKIDAVAAWLNSPVQRGYVEGTDRPYYNWFQRLVFALAQAIAWLYRVAVWPLLALGLWGMGRVLGRGIAILFRERRSSASLLAGLALLGLLLSFVLRLVVAAYMEVASFGVGTTPMYLAGGVPALLLFCALGPIGLGRAPAGAGPLSAPGAASQGQSYVPRRTPHRAPSNVPQRTPQRAPQGGQQRPPQTTPQRTPHRAPRENPNR